MGKKLLSFCLFFFAATIIVAQKDSLLIAGPGGGGITPPPNNGYKIIFNYDTSGNQVKRYLDNTYSSKQNITAKDTAKSIEEKQEVISQLTYYPNPIKNELTISWSKSINSSVNTVNVFTMDSKLVKQLNASKNNQELKIPFQDVSSGIYIIKVLFTNGKQDSFKVIKE